MQLKSKKFNIMIVSTVITGTTIFGGYFSEDRIPDNRQRVDIMCPEEIYTQRPNLIEGEWVVDLDSEEVQQAQNSRLALTVFYPELNGRNLQLLQLDNLPGIKRLEPISDKGLKGEKKYEKDGQLIWSMTTKYWFEDGATFLDGVVKIVKLFTIGGQVADTWEKQVVLSVDDKEEVRKVQRERILTYFKSQQPELFSLLYNFFKSNIDDYVAVGNKPAFEAVLTEAAENHPYQENNIYVVRDTLSMVVPTQSGGTTTVLEGILNELV